MKKCLNIVFMASLVFLCHMPVMAAENNCDADNVTYNLCNRQIGSSFKGTKQQDSLERCIHKGVTSFKKEINVSDYKIPKEEGVGLFFKILDENPEIFYVESVGYTYSDRTGYIETYSVNYQYEPNEIVMHKAEMESVADVIVSGIDDGSSNLEKALFVHDYLALHCKYAKEIKEGGYSQEAHTSYGCLVEGEAVCDGYSDAFSYIMQNCFHIPCKTIISEKMNHAWNIIYINNNWYHIDLTWDDPTKDIIGNVSHEYFMLSDLAIRKHEHYGWDFKNKASSKIYDKAFWKNVNSAIIKHDNEWYYSVYNDVNLQARLVKRKDLTKGQSQVVYKTDGWHFGMVYYSESFMYLCKSNEKIYFNTQDKIMMLDEKGHVKQIHNPKVPKNKALFGFMVDNGKLCYAIQKSPEYKTKQKILTYDLKEYETEEERYAIPAGLSCESGTYLSDIMLPKGFTWEKADGVKLIYEGIYTYYATFTPKNKNNPPVCSIPVQIQVKCSKHNFCPDKNGMQTCTVCGSRRSIQ